MAKKVEEKKEEIDVSKLKKELINYVDIQIKKGFNEEVEKANRRVIREKNKKIFVKNIVIILLLCLVIFLLYLLNSVDYFDKFFVNEKEPTKIIDKEENIEPEKVEIKEKTFAELKEKYGYLIDKVVINENNEYIKDYYDGNLTSTLKKYIVLNNMDLETFIVDDYCVIDNDVLENEYNKLFNDEYVSESFLYNNVKVSYIEKLKSYITNTILTKEKSNIKREIISISESDNEIVITTIEGLIKDKKLYNIVTKEEVKDYKKDNLSNYKKYLNEINYTFENNKLVSIK